MTTIWTDGGYETGDWTGWSTIQAIDPQQGPGATYCFVATGASLGIPAHSGSYVAQFQRPASATTLPHAKVFKEWSTVGKHDDFGRTMTPLPNGNNPNGIYRSNYYFPTNYVAASEWTNVFQFKEHGTFAFSGTTDQFPSWWINTSPGSGWGVGGTEPWLFINHWNNAWGYTPVLKRVPLGRWFELRADLYEGDHIDFYLDGVKFDTALNSVWPVGRFANPGTSDGWIFGVGHYGGIGTLWNDDSSLVSLPTPDQVRTTSYLATSLADNTTGQITAQSMREFMTTSFNFESPFIMDIATPTNRTVYLDLNASEAYTIDSLFAGLSSGTLTAAVQINGVNVTGLSAVPVTSTEVITNATGANTVAIGDDVTMVISGVTSAAGFSFKLNRIRL